MPPVLCVGCGAAGGPSPCAQCGTLRRSEGWTSRRPGQRAKAFFVALGLLTFAGFLGIVALSVAHLLVEERDATLGRWIAVLAFAAVIFALAAWCAKNAVEVLAVALGREWEIVSDGGAVAGIVRTTFGAVTFGGVMHARVEQTARSFEVTTADVAAAGADRVRAAMRAAPMQVESLFGLASMVAGVVSLDLAKVYRVEQRGWSKQGLFARRRHAPQIHTLLFERTAVTTSSAPAHEAAFAAALEALGRKVADRTRFPLADVLFEMGALAALTVAPSSRPYRSLGAEPGEVAARLDAFYDDLRFGELAFDDVPSQMVAALALARQVSGR